MTDLRRGRLLARTLWAALCLFAALPAAAQTGRDAAPPQAGAGPAGAAVELPTELAWIGGATLEFHVQRAPRPRATLIFENGLMLSLTTWGKVVAALSGQADMLLYNRPGVGRSELPQDAEDAGQTTRRLQALLREQDLPPPYIVVGHSMGGLYAQLYAALYPRQVGGLVLVDALPPGALKPVADFPWYTRVGLQLFAPAQVQRELQQAPEIGETLLARRGEFDRPVLRLVAEPDPRAAKPEGLIKDLLRGVVYAEDFGVWAIDPEIAERELDTIYPQSSVRRIQAHHRVQETAPERVVAAIAQVIEQQAADSPERGGVEARPLP